jgi:hypothetical protein
MLATLSSGGGTYAARYHGDVSSTMIRSRANDTPSPAPVPGDNHFALNASDGQETSEIRLARVDATETQWMIGAEYDVVQTIGQYRNDTHCICLHSKATDCASPVSGRPGHCTVQTCRKLRCSPSGFLVCKLQHLDEFTVLSGQEHDGMVTCALQTALMPVIETSPSTN